MNYAGIDTGVSGAIAFLGSVAGSIPFDMQKLPLMNVGKRQEIDVVALWSLILPKISTGDASLSWIHKNEITVIIEECSYHQPSHAAMRSQALSYGKLVALLEIKQIKFIAVQAQKWQKEILGKIPKGDTKKAALGMARRLWPMESFIPEGCRVPSDAFCDAALLAEYGRRKSL